LRHLWSLAVEEQWYLLWPLLFLSLSRVIRRNAVRGAVLLAIAAGVIGLTWWMARAPQLTDDRVNLLYLSTFTRSSGLLLGAAAAFVWRPWRRGDLTGRRRGWALDGVGALAIATLGWQFVDAALTERSIYRWQLALVSCASLALVSVVVHPGSRLLRPLFALRPVAELGKRSYGLYLWSWPVSVACDGFTGSWSRFALAMSITAVVSELSYRCVETPIRHGALGRWFSSPRSQRTGHWHIVTASSGVAVAAVVAPLAIFFAGVEHVDPALGGEEVVFALPARAPVTVDPDAVTPSLTSPPATVPTETIGTVAPTSSEPAASTTRPTLEPVPVSDAQAEVTTTVVGPPATAPILPRQLVIVGDSTAHALAVNLPLGIEATFTIADGSLDGCSVSDDGEVRSEAAFRRSFVDCAGWEDRWARAAVRSGSNLALVVIGAWEVFDVEVDGDLVPFGSAVGDARFEAGLQRGIDALTAEGVHVALLEVPCMRPQDVKGAGVPALPERGDDARVAHLNDLMRRVADRQPETVTFVPGPTEWCADEAIANDLGYRWDGVHVYKPGANLVYTTIAQRLLDIPL
jgi:hypothetical protein